MDQFGDRKRRVVATVARLRRMTDRRRSAAEPRRRARAVSITVGIDIERRANVRGALRRDGATLAVVAQAFRADTDLRGRAGRRAAWRHATSTAPSCAAGSSAEAASGRPADGVRPAARIASRSGGCGRPTAAVAGGAARATSTTAGLATVIAEVGIGEGRAGDSVAGR